MKHNLKSNKILLSLIVALCVITSGSVYGKGTQLIEEIDSGIMFYNPSIVIDNNDEPNICYDEGFGNLVFAVQKESGWDKTVVDNLGGKTFRATLDVDNDRNPHISYTVEDIGLKYAERRGTDWTISIIEHGSLVFPSLAIDSKGFSHISYIDWANSSLKYSSWTGSSWQIETVETFDNDTNIWYNRIEIDSEDNPHIVYSYKVGGPDGDGEIRYANRNNNDWIIETVASSGEIDPSSFCLDSNNRPSIALWHGYMKYAFKSHENWEIESVPSVISNNPIDSLAINSKGEPVLCYFDSDNETIKSATRTGDGWQITEIYKSHDSPLGTYITLYHILDSEDNHHFLIENMMYLNLYYLYSASSIDSSFSTLKLAVATIIVISVTSAVIIHHYKKRKTVDKSPTDQEEQHP